LLRQTTERVGVDDGLPIEEVGLLQPIHRVVAEGIGVAIGYTMAD
jgi:hypothetical protein